MAFRKIFDFLLYSEKPTNYYFNKFPFTYPLQILLIVALYLLIIYKIGPQFMKNRQPYSLKHTIIVYNILQLVFNGYIFYLMLPLLGVLKVECPSADDDNSLPKETMHKSYYYYALLKLFDVIETIFFVLRKKNRQVSLLHVHHHILMIILPIFVAKYFPTVHGAVLGSINTFVHFVMYFYYLCSVWKKQSVWWKKYVTILQIVQHYIVFFHYITVFVQWDCNYPPKWIQGLAVTNNFIVICLFTKFYMKNYIKTNKTS